MTAHTIHHTRNATGGGGGGGRSSSTPRSTATASPAARNSSTMLTPIAEHCGTSSNSTLGSSTPSSRRSRRVFGTSAFAVGRVEADDDGAPPTYSDGHQSASLAAQQPAVHPAYAAASRLSGSVDISAHPIRSAPVQQPSLLAPTGGGEEEMTLAQVSRQIVQMSEQIAQLTSHLATSVHQNAQLISLVRRHGILSGEQASQWQHAQASPLPTAATALASTDGHPVDLYATPPPRQKQHQQQARILSPASTSSDYSHVIGRNAAAASTKQYWPPPHPQLADAARSTSAEAAASLTISPAQRVPVHADVTPPVLLQTFGEAISSPLRNSSTPNSDRQLQSEYTGARLDAGSHPDQPLRSPSANEEPALDNLVADLPCGEASDGSGEQSRPTKRVKTSDVVLEDWMEWQTPRRSIAASTARARYRTLQNVRLDRHVKTNRSLSALGRLPLKDYLEVDEDDYRAVRRLGRALYRQWLQANVRINKQNVDRLRACFHKIEHDFPLLADCEEHWKARALIQQVIDNSADDRDRKVQSEGLHSSAVPPPPSALPPIRKRGRPKGSTKAALAARRLLWEKGNEEIDGSGGELGEDLYDVEHMAAAG